MSSVVSQVVVETDPNTGRYMKAGGQAVLKADPVTGALEGLGPQDRRKGSM
jgi:hypothetical protein